MSELWCHCACWLSSLIKSDWLYQLRPDFLMMFTGHVSKQLEINGCLYSFEELRLDYKSSAGRELNRNPTTSPTNMSFPVKTDSVVNVSASEMERALGALRVLQIIGDDAMKSRECRSPDLFDFQLINIRVLDYFGSEHSLPRRTGLPSGHHQYPDRGCRAIDVVS
jgi:hypothetical protein